MTALSKEKLRTEFDYEAIGEFCEGLAFAEKDGMAFHILPDGTPAYTERYDAVGHFKEGLAWVAKDEKTFHIHPDGTPAYAERYDQVSEFNDGLARAVIDDQGAFFIRPDGARAL